MPFWGLTAMYELLQHLNLESIDFNRMNTFLPQVSPLQFIHMNRGLPWCGKIYGPGFSSPWGWCPSPSSPKNTKRPRSFLLLPRNLGPLNLRIWYGVCWDLVPFNFWLDWQVYLHKKHAKGSTAAHGPLAWATGIVSQCQRPKNVGLQ